jgi:hypothetical protein
MTTGPDEGNLPSIEDLTGTGPEISSAELSAAIREQLGSDVPGSFGTRSYRQAYAEHRRRGYPDTGDLRERMGI